MTIFEIELFGLTLAPSYYGLMYVLGFLYGIWAIKKTHAYTQKQREDLLLYIFLGVLVGGRLGYVFFYDLTSFVQNPLSIIEVWNGGMSFHGGCIGVCLSIYLFSLRYKISLWRIGDDIAKIAPVGIFFGRIGNYLNKELLGFPYEGFLAVQTQTGSYFPSPLMEAFLEGIVIFILLNFIHKKSFPGKLTSLFFIYYGLFRILVEIFVRTPDPQIGYYFGFLTQGSLLSIPMILIGIILYFYLKKVYATR